MRAIGALTLPLFLLSACDDDSAAGTTTDVTTDVVETDTASSDVAESDTSPADDVPPAEDVPLEDTAGEDVADPDVPLAEDVDAVDTSDAADTDGPEPCGGLLGLTCAENEFCDYEPGTFCGGDDSLGVCKLRPMDCVGEPTEPVCGCDGEAYPNECLASAAGADVASEGACSGQCLAAGDCDSGTSGYCVKPDAPAACGICFDPTGPPCADDEECTGGEVCEWDSAPCLCEPQRVCQPACTPGSCEEGETCGEDGHCALTACDDPGDCPTHYDCVEGACVRAACDEPGGCPSGYCVLGACYAEPGVCQLPVP